MNKFYLLIPLGMLGFVMACCSQKTVTDSPKTESVTPLPSGNYFGFVSHRYRSTGCSTVLILTGKEDGRETILIPIDTLSAKFDVDGLEITFNYKLQKRPNPPGCSAGMPAFIFDISEK